MSLSHRKFKETKSDDFRKIFIYLLWKEFFGSILCTDRRMTRDVDTIELDQWLLFEINSALTSRRVANVCSYSFSFWSDIFFFRFLFRVRTGYCSSKLSTWPGVPRVHINHDQAFIKLRLCSSQFQISLFVITCSNRIPIVESWV